MMNVSKPATWESLGLPAFDAISFEALAPLLERAQAREYPPGSHLFTPSDPAERMFALEVGRVDVYRLTTTGKRLVVRRVFPQTFFGVLGLSLQECFAEAVEPCVARVVTREEMLEAFRQRPEIALRILEVLGGRLRQTEEMLEQAFFSPARVRLANFLLRNMDPSTGLLARYTHEEIGDSIGAVRQTVTEALRLMCQEGLVKVECRQIRVVDGEKLESVAWNREPPSG